MCYQLKESRRKKGFYCCNRLEKDMTYILGARCIDGVVLIADTKVTIGEGTDYTFSKKIMVQPLTNIVMGSAGIGGLYKEFQNRVVSSVMQLERENKEEPIIATEEEFSVLVSKVIRDMHNDYGDDRYLILNNLMILCASRVGSHIAQLTAFTPIGFPEPVNHNRAIGHGEPYGSLFLKKMWNKNMAMEQTAKLGVFIIKFIDDMHLDESVGFNDEYLPQVVYIPDMKLPDNFPECPPPELSDKKMEELQREYLELTKKYPIKELSHEDVKYFVNEISSKISDFEDLFKSGQFRL